MDQGLFAKHLRSINERTNAKQTIITAVLEKTGIPLDEKEITLQGKKITLATSSVKKAALMQKKGKEVLSALGYLLQV
jgi:hypothetical protein